MVRIPDPSTHRAQFAQLPFTERRQVVGAVNRGREVADVRLAGHAVIVARRQARLWRYAWLLGPLVGAFRLLDSWQAALISASVSTFILGLMSWWWYSRAVQAEQRNYALTTEGKREARRARKGGGRPSGEAAGGVAGPRSRRGRRGHLPSSGD